MYLTYGYSYALHGIGVDVARAWFSGDSGTEGTMVGPWINVMELHAGKRLELHAGQRLELETGERLELING